MDDDEARRSLKDTLLDAVESLSTHACPCGHLKRWPQSTEYRDAEDVVCHRCETKARHWVKITDALLAAHRIGGESAVRAMIRAGRA